jgi:hypothetical protein
MNRKTLSNNIAFFVAAAMLLATPGWANSAAIGGISGTYRVVGKTEAGAHTRVRLKVHLTNHGQTLVHIGRLGLEEVTSSARTAHKEKAQACSVAIAAGGAADTTQEFTIPRAEFRTWQHGGAPRLLLEIEGPGGHKTTEAVRLTQVGENRAGENRVSGGEVK